MVHGPHTIFIKTNDEFFKSNFAEVSVHIM